MPAEVTARILMRSFIGYARAVGIHCWAEFYAQGIGWVPVDTSEAAKNPAKREYFFGAHDENRIEFSDNDRSRGGVEFNW
jgi:transglutaminase-like putative cysteine protease